MNLLPNYKYAEIDIAKLTEYCLNINHPEGKDKAIVFKSALNISADNADLLKAAILKQLSKSEAIIKEETKYGKKYSVLMKIRIFDREANILTAWIIDKGEEFPRLVSCYIKE